MGLSETTSKGYARWTVDMSEGGRVGTRPMVSNIRLLLYG